MLDTKEYILYDSVYIKPKQAKLSYVIWGWESGSQKEISDWNGTWGGPMRSISGLFP